MGGGVSLFFKVFYSILYESSFQVILEETQISNLYRYFQAAEKIVTVLVQNGINSWVACIMHAKQVWLFNSLLAFLLDREITLANSKDYTVILDDYTSDN